VRPRRGSKAAAAENVECGVAFAEIKEGCVPARENVGSCAAAVARD
jgi:hypothetical protein